MSKAKADSITHTQKEELILAKKEARQPRCVYCGKPLDTVCQTQGVDITWTWDKQTKTYIKDDSEGDSYKPYCGNCTRHDRDFSNNDFIKY